MERISKGFLNAPIFSIELSGEVGDGFGPFWRGSELIGRLISLRRHFAHLIRRNHQPIPIWAIEILKKRSMVFSIAKNLNFQEKHFEKIVCAEEFCSKCNRFSAFNAIFRKAECYSMCSRKILMRISRCGQLILFNTYNN